MSVLNQMLRDLEKRGAMPDVVAAAGTATVARPALPLHERPAALRRHWIWAGVLAVAAAFVGVHTWLNYRVQEAGTARAPLGARQYAAVLAPEQSNSVTPPAPAPVPAPATSAPSASMPVLTSPLTPAAAEAPAKPAPQTTNPPSARKPRADSSPSTRTPSRAPTPAATIVAAPAAPSTEAVPQAVVARSSGDVARDVDRAAEFIARGRANEAMELLVQVLQRQPTHAEARSSLAALLAEAGRREQALHVLLAGNEIEPGRFAMPAAQLQAELGDLQGALKTLARVPATRRTAAFEALHAGLAQRAGDHMSAIAAYRRALAQPQANPVWWVGLGVSLEATGEPAEARSAYTRAAGEARLPADVRGYVRERLAALDARGEQARRASLANIF